MGITPRVPTTNGQINGAPKTAKKTPVDIEELLARKKAAAEAASKPKFIPKAERERLAAEKAKKEEEEKQKQKQKEAASRNDSWSNGTSTQTNGRSQNDSRQDRRAGDRYYRDGPAVPTGPKAMRQNQSQNHHHDDRRKGGNKDKDGKKRPAPEEAEAVLIRERYMGPETNVSTFSALKKRKRTTEKKFNFEWDASEDTSQDHNPIYSDRVAPTFFGRGRLGGFGDDMTEENTRRYAQSLIERDPENGAARAQEMLEMMQRAKERANRNALGKHWSEKKLEEMKERDWRIFKEDFGIATKGGYIPNPMRSWQESGLPRLLLDIIAQVGYDEPSPIQRAAIPIALQARDLIGVAVTGSGKTAAFLLPLLVYISELPPLTEINKNDGPYALILAPTRELVQQIETEARKFSTPLGFTVVSLVGGHALEEQAFALRNGAEIIVATPGRLVDCIERRLLVLSQCCYVIMDEADRMIDMGFEEPVNKILDALPVTNEKPDTDEAENAQLMSRHLGGKDRYRQTMMYTATMPPIVERIAKKYLRRPATVAIGNAGEAVDTVEQRVEFVSGEDRRKKRLREILLDGGFKAPIIVFVNIKRNCDAIAKEISRMGLSVATLHGSKTQDQREQALNSVRAGNTEVLVATDLAGRGIDVPDVSLVVNFNMATSIEAYTHRIGRTGRAGKSGVAITFLGSEDADVMYDLKQMLSKSSISRVPEELRRHEAAQQKPSRVRKTVNENSGPTGFDNKSSGWN
ncbi:Pre-mRNA-splicing ATP-dependent RNA helicase prp28 [Pestalotiopsis fici W106-1]|uniref:RNA helicase n=1 Tax=Pestalotiopsis fici (strain W106-1 / CGMCC3.15140) TaxID=1229662 RepID=W3XRA0_PESFW|nr:Pre-mRNA-splicing ATP-dependent RNA helicase prp28 [Pestalotiopsis fici W106-1]ETS87726.1 Pre-mRNA-splicing ATP-dependent RNA helicase prp28 [Pestalotiopsis fici W106-1]